MECLIIPHHPPYNDIVSYLYGSLDDTKCSGPGHEKGADTIKNFKASDNLRNITVLIRGEHVFCTTKRVISSNVPVPGCTPLPFRWWHPTLITIQAQATPPGTMNKWHDGCSEIDFVTSFLANRISRNDSDLSISIYSIVSVLTSSIWFLPIWNFGYL